MDALGGKGWAYKVDAGGGAFYGPKIDIKIQDAIGRKWQCSTIQAGPSCCLTLIHFLSHHPGRSLWLSHPGRVAPTLPH